MQRKNARQKARFALPNPQKSQAFNGSPPSAFPRGKAICLKLLAMAEKTI
jgi:hypothetical protein